MYRTAIEQLSQWKAKANRKPLLIRGARQVGKTWLMKEFGATAYQRSVYINFDQNQQMKNLFAIDLNLERIMVGLELYAGEKIDPDTTVIIFDEVQESPQALASLKYFCENAPQYHIISAGSLLGVALHRGTSFPVGKVEFLDLYPLSFSEFMLALGEKRFVELLQLSDFPMISAFKLKYIELLKLYYYIGGMPEVVQSFVDLHDFNLVRSRQQSILEAYEQDFSKHASNDVVPRIRMLFQSIPSQLAKENKKFVYGLVKEGARAKEYEMALLWLSDCGLIHQVRRVQKPGIPLKAYEDIRAFKLFFADVGLLSCLVHLNQRTLLEGNALFEEFKGALTEQYVLQQIKTPGNMDVFYWTNERGAAEIDFILEIDGNVIPIEVKAGINLQAKSLKAYRDKYHPTISVRASMADYRKEDGLVNLPLYAIEYIHGILDKTK